MLWRTRFFIMVMKLLIIIPSCVLVIFVDMNMYILTERRNFKTFWKARKLCNWFGQLLPVQS